MPESVGQLQASSNNDVSSRYRPCESAVDEDYKQWVAQIAGNHRYFVTFFRDFGEKNLAKVEDACILASFKRRNQE